MGKKDWRAQDGDADTVSGQREPSLADVVDLRTRVWELHLRGLPRTRIAEQVGLNRQTVGRYITACLREMGAEQREQRERMLAAAVARMRRVQEEAWADHDADDERERAVLALVVGEAGAIDGGEAQGEKRDERERGGERGSGGRIMARYQSQRAQYLRVILDAEREIARLHGLYEAGAAVDGAIVFRIERLGAEGLPGSSARNVSIETDTDNGTAGEEDGGTDAGG